MQRQERLSAQVRAHLGKERKVSLIDERNHPGGLCRLLADGIQQFREELARLGRKAAALRTLLGQLQGKTDPDPAKIAEAERQLTGVERELMDAQGSLAALEEEYTFAGCGG